MTNVNQGDAVRIKTTWKDFNGTLVDPASHSLNIYNPSGVLVVGPVTNPTKLETGIYYYEYDTASDAPLGAWKYVWTAKIGGLDETVAGGFNIVAPIHGWVDSATAADVIAEAGNPEPSELGFADAIAMSAHITTFLLPAAQSAVEQYLHRTYTDADAPNQVKHVALKVAALGLQKIRAKKLGLLIRVGDYAVELSDPTIFTPELKAELKDFILGRTSHISISPYKTDEIKERWDEE